MNKKNRLFLGLLLLLSLGCRDSEIPRHVDIAETPAITGGPADEELARLLSRVVPYDPGEKNSLPEEKRFLYNLNKLLNEDLAAQSDKYKLAVAKLALRTALAMNKMVDSIEVRRYSSRVKEPYGDFSGNYGINVKGNFWWVLGGVIEDRTQWDNTNYYGDSTTVLFTLNAGRITKVNVSTLVDTCGGRFSGCCGGSASPPGLDDAWYQNFIDLGRQEDFPIAASDYTPKILEHMIESRTEPIESFQIQGTRSTPEGIANLVKLQDLKHLTVDLEVYAKEPETKREAFFDLFPKLPQLHTIEMNTGLVTVSQMQKLAKCENLTHLTLTGFSAETPGVFAPVNRMKKLKKLVISSGDRWSPQHWLWSHYSWKYPFENISPIDKKRLPSEIVELHDLPNLEHLFLVGTTQGHPFSLKNLPNLTFLVTDTPLLIGDVFTEQTPPNLKVLVCAGLEITEEQIRHIAALKQLETLGLYQLHPENLNIFSPLENAKTLKHLALVFPERYSNMTLTTPPVELSALSVRFPDGWHRNHRNLKLKIPKLAENYDLNIENVTLIDEIPPTPGNVSCRNTAMTYTQFQTFFKNKGNVQHPTFNFERLILTDIDTENLFVDFVFPGTLKLGFDRESESLKGKTLHFENCDQLNWLDISGINLAETDVCLSELPGMRNCQIKGQ